ncbi:hypothetical protein [Elizabethkingia ursingii]|uniref:hypothetical protein n=1 Tax=Elizabethkingia ursingii TaxID=1756150 RepID=UPI0007509E20|nr:hypothetical protein [Elizabethkingia ursingii]KUY30039.1 hypothetical protein ATB96_15805 [Elizabethkingia ursingii]
MIEYLDNLTKNLNPIIQGIIGSAIFAILIVLGRKLYFYITNLNSSRKQKRLKEDILKILIYQHIYSNNKFSFNNKAFILFIKAFNDFFISVAVLISGKILESVSPIPYTFIFFGYLSIQNLISAASWVNVKWKDVDLKGYDVNLIEEVKNEYKI